MGEAVQLGLCGIDNKLLEAKKIKDELGYVGTVTQVNNESLRMQSRVDIFQLLRLSQWMMKVIVIM